MLDLPRYADIAAALDVSLDTVKGWMSGRQACAVTYVDQIAERFGLDRGALVEHLAERWRAKHPEET